MGFISDQIHAAITETQLDYMQRIVDTITSIDPRITCNTTAAAQYADDTNTATFDFSIDDKYIIRIKRRNVNSNNDSSFFISMIVNNIEYNISSAIRMFYTSGKASTAVTNGWFKIAAYVSDNDIFIWFGAHHDTAISDILPTTYSTLLITDMNDVNYCGSVAGSNDVTAVGLYKCSDGTTGYALVKCLNYTESAGNISYIENNPISSTGAFASYAKDIKACTTIGAGTSIVLLTGEKCFAVGTNALVLIDE